MQKGMDGNTEEGEGDTRRKVGRTKEEKVT